MRAAMWYARGQLGPNIMRKSKEADRAYKKVWAAKNRIRMNVQARAWARRNPEKVLAYARKARGVIPTRPEPDICEVCDTPRKRKALCADHCHLTGEFRGWLCDPCNVILGLVNDSVPRLRGLATYLESFYARGTVR
jgi:recombination endonuclease VII